MTTVASPSTVAVAEHADQPGRSSRPGSFTGLRELVRLMLRRDRLRLTLWFVGIVGLVVATAASIIGLYGTQAELDQYGRLVRNNTALIVQAGPGYGLDHPTTGAVMMNELAIWVIIAISLMAVFMMVRHTRTEEESERAELIRAAPVGRHAPLAASLLSATAANVLVVGGVVTSLMAFGLPVTGSLAFGASLIGAGGVFAGVTAVTAQVAGTSRAALALGGTTIAMSFVLRAVGDVGDGRLSWLSPIGWAQGIRAYADERWWVLILPVVATAGLVTAAVTLQANRDFGAGILPQRAGPPSAGRLLGTPFGLAVRLQRSSVIGWTVGLALVGFFYGIVADQAESIIEDNPDMADFFAQLGESSITDAFLSTSILILALFGTGFTISSVLRLRTEESSTHADSILATPTTRLRWVSSHVAVAVAGTTAIMAVTGSAIGAGFALMTGDAGQIPRILGAALVMVPAMLVMAGVTLLVHGAAPRLGLLAWGGLVFVCVVGMLGTVLKLPQWTLELSPYQHVPALPAESFSLLPLAVLCIVAAAFTALGVVAVERRDIG